MQHFFYKATAVVGAVIICLGAAILHEAPWGNSVSMMAIGTLIFLAGLIGSWFND
jgi:fucose permease